ncbi:MAG TPA: hypothetical protein VF230_04115 [Acidimicrobiales bacterium]
MSIDESDLYPPDVEHLTPEMRQQRLRTIAGVALVGIGCGLILERTLDADLDYFWLCIGIGLVVGWARVPRFAMFAVGAIMTGFAAGDFVASLIHVPFETPINLLLDAVGFVAVYVRYPRQARWALVPAAIFAALTVASIGVELIGFIPGSVTGLLLPLLLIAGGGLLLARHSLPRPLVCGGLAIIAVVFIASAASSLDGWDGPELSIGSRELTEDIDGEDLDGRILVLDVPRGSIKVDVIGESEDAEVTARVRGHHKRDGDIEVEVDDDDEGDEVRVGLDEDFEGFMRNRRDVDWVLRVPKGTELELRSDTAPITLDVDGIDVRVEAEVGRVDARIRDEGSLGVTATTAEVTLDDRSETTDANYRLTASSIFIPGEADTRTSYRNEGGADGEELGVDVTAETASAIRLRTAA